jgi:hypothetical protein
MTLPFATDLAVGFTSNQSERDVRPVKVQQRTPGGTWQTILGLADFPIVQSCLSTAAKRAMSGIRALSAAHPCRFSAGCDVSGSRGVLPRGPPPHHGGGLTCFAQVGGRSEWQPSFRRRC